MDAIVERDELKDTLGKILRLHRPTEGYANFDPAHDDDRYEPTELMRERNTFSRPLEPWDKVMAARQMKRLASVDYMGQILMNSWNCTETVISVMIRQLSVVLPIWMDSR